MARILVIDHDDTIRDMARTILTSAGHEVVEARGDEPDLLSRRGGSLAGFPRSGAASSGVAGLIEQLRDAFPETEFVPLPAPFRVPARVSR